MTLVECNKGVGARVGGVERGQGLLMISCLIFYHQWMCWRAVDGRPNENS